MLYYWFVLQFPLPLGCAQVTPTEYGRKVRLDLKVCVLQAIHLYLH